MKGFLWSKSKKSSGNKGNEKTSRHTKRSISSSSSSSSSLNILPQTATAETLTNSLRDKSSSSNLSVSSSRQHHLSKHSIKSIGNAPVDPMKRQSSLSSADHHSTERKIYSSDAHARSSRSILPNHHLNMMSSHNPSREDTQSIISNETATTVNASIASNDDSHPTHHISKEDIGGPILSPVSSSLQPSGIRKINTVQSSLTNEQQQRRDTITRLLVHLNDDNFDTNTFKIGWVNRSHGQIMAQQQPHTQLPHSNSTQHLRERKMSHRESVLFGADMLAQLSSMETESHRDSVRLDSGNQRNSTIVDAQTMVPDYRIYRAELKGCLLNLYKDGLGSNIKYFDPTAIPPEVNEPQRIENSNKIEFNDNKPNLQQVSNKRATISGSKYFMTDVPSSKRGIDPDHNKEHIDPKAILPIEIKYLSEKYPHPNLKLDKEGRIIGGDVESLCHAVLFSPMSSGKHSVSTSKKQRTIVNILLLLPLVDYFIKFIITFNQFGLTFTKHKMKLTTTSLQYHNITNEMDDQLSERLALVGKTILDIMPGFLLDEQIFQATIALLNTISLHNDELSNNLKISIANRHNEMTSLTSYIRVDPSVSRTNSSTSKVSGNSLLNDVLDFKKFLDVDTTFFANEVHLINLKFDKIWTPREDYSLLYSSKYINQNILALNPLVFNNSENLHFLGRLLVCHLFPSNPLSITPKTRAKILRKWVQLGCKFEHLGDMVSWLAIATVLCSVPILRLFKSWQYVSETTLKIIFKDWVPTIAQLERRQASSKSTSSVFILAPPNLNDPFIRDNVISYFGDLIIYADDLSQNTKFKYLEKKINRTKNAFHKWQQRLETVKETAKGPIKTNNLESIDPKTSSVYQFWKYHVTQPSINIENIMKLSLQYEPPAIDPYLYSGMNSRRSPLLTGSYLPILFNELQPNYSLFPKKSLIGAAGPTINNTPAIPLRSSARRSSTLSTIGKSESLLNLNAPSSGNDTNQITGIGKIDGPTIKELAQRQSTQQTLMKSIRDMFNIDTDLFHVTDDLVFKSNIEKAVKSRPTSIVVESPRKFSQQSFGNNSSRDSHDMNRLSKTLENMNFFEGIGNVSDTFNESVIDVVLKSASLERIFDLLVLTANVFSKLVDTKDLENHFKHKNRGVNAREGKEQNSMGLLDYAFVKLVLDDDVFTETFFDSYRSFTTTTNVLENLAKRYIGAKSCAVTITSMLDLGKDPKNHVENQNFPNWNSKILDEKYVNLIYVAKIQIGAAEAIHHLVLNHYSDFTDDPKCNSIFFDILKVMEKEVTYEWSSRLQNIKEEEDEYVGSYEDVSKLVEKLTQLFQMTKATYQKELYRPVGINRTQKKITEILESFKSFSYDELRSLLNSKQLDDSLLAEFQNIKHDNYEGILNWLQDLNNFIAERMQFIDKRDWIAVYQILELESSKSLTSFYNYPLNVLSSNLVNTTSAQLKDLEILNIITWVSTLVTTNKLSENQSLILEKLPNSIQIIIKLHHSLTAFFQVIISNSKISLNERNGVCAVLIQMLNYTRNKNATLDLFESTESADPHVLSSHIPSFIESAISNAIISPESRFYEQSWKNGHALLCRNQDPSHQSFNSIGDILEGIDDKHMKSFIEIDNVFDSCIPSLAPCPGWLICRLLEISQFVPNMSISNTRLINFDKRRFVHNIISNISALIPGKTKKLSSKCGYILMNDFQDSDKSFRKASKELALSEARESKYQETGVFNDILILEVDKIRREQSKLNSLRTQERDAIHSNKMQQDINRQKGGFSSMNSLQTSSHYGSSSVSSTNGIGSTSGTMSKKSRNSITNLPNRSSVGSANQPSQAGGVSKKLGGFFRRPFSIAGFNTSISNYSLNSSISQDVGSKKVIESYLLPDLTNQVINDSKPTLCLKTFEIKSILEIMNHRNIPAYSFSFKIIMQDNHEYTIQATSSEDLYEWIKMIKASKRYSFHSKKFKGRTSNKVFGVPLEDICAREGTVIPTIIIKLLEEIEFRGLDEVGLYRIPGSVGSINALKNAFDEEGATSNTFTLEDDRWFEINAIAGCFKMYLRELPDSLFTNEKVSQFTQLALSRKSNEISFDVYKSNMTTLLNQLPVCYYQTMRRIVLHLNKVHQHVSTNRMDASNLAIVFSMSFIDQEDLSNSMGPTLGAVQSILQDFIKTPNDYFIEMK
ncbi:similar to Saccharomyces cerevisiae YER155C BEM2 Rho GTPase activating protein (RhoGAP) involved in the control of cytoskeleton organization and cellular morphogenesis [Maudiozyma barnettii]|uniref:Similar to Saccharomyces cerevisiae YER155C BEM2 Rho GTPase activating protein (RhoGAP) involved in the control of cytoskeleton organization and cellular morphogenesis n=1 Tax=Maudiozyma barnettii TaxID=61262 RepID=A0A8H2VHG8_9SACH|nr:GTPase-activating protein BEM2 [Kazachstania barnettii]CAB4255516.1 similar to Saccharomyces cerevisiae YER155C BEM2 Rho GTPase activating protein (RhoGAP) involved in the control of cytoskeleton organization and cellular morphogenesis [Kazachstania barnettii]CAD1784015.1 similar to Saccharomyces cerevisiae YER155C BEM2 Rho GTPase activating protein (RhoGAP) involved in the control of cytoskeleton organization and cellular morphogenesis [Kazachstania barnettii]